MAASNAIPTTAEAFPPYMEALCRPSAVRPYIHPQSEQQFDKQSEEHAIRREVLSRSTGEGWQCVICGSEKPDVARIARACLCEDRPCSSHECNCHVTANLEIYTTNNTESALGADTADAVNGAPCASESSNYSAAFSSSRVDVSVYRACKDCVFKTLWSGTSAALRENGVFRAKCPFCKADFCQHDVVLLRWPEDDEFERLASKSAAAAASNRSRKRGGKRRSRGCQW